MKIQEAIDKLYKTGLELQQVRINTEVDDPSEEIEDAMYAAEDAVYAARLLLEKARDKAGAA